MKPKGRATSFAILTVALFSILILARVKEQFSVQIRADKYMSALTLMSVKSGDIRHIIKKQYFPIALETIFSWVARDAANNVQRIRSDEEFVIYNDSQNFRAVSGWVLTNARFDESTKRPSNVVLVFKEQLPDNNQTSLWDSLEFFMQSPGLGGGGGPPFSESKLVSNGVGMTYQDISYNLIIMAKYTGIVTESGNEAYYVLKRSWETQSVRLPIIDQDIKAVWAAIALPILIIALCALLTSEVRSKPRSSQNIPDSVFLLDAKWLHERLFLLVLKICVILSPVVVLYSSASILSLLQGTAFWLKLPIWILCGWSEISLIALFWQKEWLGSCYFKDLLKRYRTRERPA